MRKPKGPAPFDVCIVVWEDATGNGNDSHASVADALKNYRPCIRRSVGHYAGYAEKNGRRALILATDDDRSEGAEESLGGTITIPEGMVLKIEVLPAQVK
jgi:hypothetical protein